MPKSSVVLVALAVLLSGLVLPTTAAGSDQLWTEPAVVLEPHDGPNGQYASLSGGKLTIDLSSNAGVNAGSLTVLEDVFYVSNQHTGPVAVWFSHAAMDDVVLSIDGTTAQGSGNYVELTPGETASVGVTIDAQSRAPGDLILSEFTIHAADLSNATATPDQPSGGGGVDATTPTPATPTATPTPKELQSTEDDAVVFADGPDSRVEIRSRPVSEVAELGGDPGPPEPAIDAAPVPRPLGAAIDAGMGVDGADVVVEVGEWLTLTGERTVFGTAEAVRSDGRVLRLVEVDVPADRGDSPAYLRLAVDRSAFGSTDPAEAVIARHTGDGWQVLETEVVDTDAHRVVLRSRVTGFSTFAVFPDPEVSYQWELRDARRVEGLSIQERFTEPGLREVTLGVTDAQSRTATADYRVLANDRPSVRIEALSSVEPGEPVTLTANVSNEVGNVTVTWQFGDGTTLVGETVQKRFETGNYLVSVAVEDEYGATGEATSTLVVGRPGNQDRVSVELFRLSLSIEERLVYAAIAILLLIAALRELADNRSRARTRRSR